jgi:16S rRNA (cytosine967-C5)-methyltransferase
VTVAPARQAAYSVIRRVFEDGSYADRALHAAVADLAPRDRALAMALAYGTVQRRATLDHVATLLSSRPPERLNPPVLASLRLGLLQLLFLGGIAEHAAVNDSVELVKRAGQGGDGFVNAVLRRATREGRRIVDGLTDATPADAAIKHSVPQWLAELWFAELGAERARALLAAVNDPPETTLRANTLVATPEQVLAELPVRAHAAPGLREGLVLEEPFDAFGAEQFRAGAIMPQSRASMLVARTLAPRPGERVLDLCAAPGAKTTHLAALMGGEGALHAVELRPQRADGLRRTAARLHAGNITVEVADAAEPRTDAAYDRVLVDPPCSGLGTLQSRPDLRWRTSPERVRDLAELQSRILAAGARATRPGGTLVYSVCTISQSEGEGVITAFLNAHKDWEPHPPSPPPGDDPWADSAWAAADAGPGRLQLMPDRDGTDGFFIARLARS